jgi:hypothetical protein
MVILVVWQITPTENMKKLEAIQRKGLSICLRLPTTSGREAMEVEGNILPVDLRAEKNILILVEEKKYYDSEFLSYNLMLNSGKKIRALRDKKINIPSPSS